jgi:hypothetical protein
MTEGKVVPFAGSLRGRFIRTMPITIGGVPKAELIERVKAVRTVSPYAKRIMKHEAFTRPSYMPIVFLCHQRPRPR